MRRVLVLTSDTGAGHRSASRALVAGAVASPERRLELFELDPYRDDDPFWQRYATDATPEIQKRVVGPIAAIADRIVTWYGPVIRHAPWLWGLAFNLAAVRAVGEAYHAVYGRTVAARIRRAIDVSRASAVVSVHPLCNRAMADATAGRLHAAVVVTDLVDVHPFWAGHPRARHVVATSEAATALAALGVNPANISILGLPLRKEFGSVDQTVREARTRVGVDPDRDVVLFMGGGDGAGSLETVVRACDRSLRTNVETAPTFVVICGRNESLRRALEVQAWRGPIRILGFESGQSTATWMVAASVIVTKPGSLTVAESLAVGRPILLGPPLPGQEEGNVPLVVEAGAGLSYRTPTGAAAALGAMLGDPARLWEMGTAALRLRRADGTTRILDLIQSITLTAT
jgi:1,2-diacylglycerol 3-beta-galactosyltransferase